MACTMNAITLDGRREQKEKLELSREIPIPCQPGQGNVTIKVSYAGVCGTDLKVRDGTFTSKSKVHLQSFLFDFI